MVAIFKERYTGHQVERSLLLANVLIQVFGLLVAAVVFIWFFKRIGLPPILAYLATGVLAGSHSIGWMAQSHEMHFVAELGIVFLLFSLEQVFDSTLDGNAQYRIWAGIIASRCH